MGVISYNKLWEIAFINSDGTYNEKYFDKGINYNDEYTDFSLFVLVPIREGVKEELDKYAEFSDNSKIITYGRYYILVCQDKWEKFFHLYSTLDDKYTASFSIKTNVDGWAKAKGRLWTRYRKLYL